MPTRLSNLYVFEAQSVCYRWCYPIIGLSYPYFRWQGVYRQVKMPTLRLGFHSYVVEAMPIDSVRHLRVEGINLHVL